MKVENNVLKIINTLKDNHYDAYLVGGCVRDNFLGSTPKDYDVCTNALPETIAEIFKEEKLLLYGLKHGTVTVVLDGECYEITTYRIDKDYKDGRHPETVEFTTDLVEDLKRRDFTINAMAYDVITNKTEDPFNGLFDLDNKIIRCVGNAEDRFNEDALRIMRALRFSAVLGFEVEESTKNAIFKLYKNLSKISWERINSEFSKLLVGKNCVKILREYKEVFFYLMPELKPMDGFNQNNKYHIHDVWEHTLHVIENTPEDLVLRLTALFHDIGKPDTYIIGEDGQGHFYTHPIKSVELTDIVLKRLRYSNLIKDNVILLIAEHSLTFEVSKKFLKRLLAKIGETALRQLLVFRKADIIGQKGKEIAVERLFKIDNISSVLDEIIAENSCFSLSDLEISGKDLIDAGIPPSKIMGKMLNATLKEVINGTLPNEKKELLKFALNSVEQSETGKWRMKQC